MGRADRAEMEDRMNRPIFVVGSPRSGTSILTWCLGQHPNIIPLEESDWLGDLAVNLALYYQTGTSRGDYTLLSSRGVEKSEFFSVFGETVNDLILRHRVDFDKKRWRRAAGPSIPEDHFVSTFSEKNRWVDGTPEYSFYICGLRKLFPEALFIHIFRDVTSVVRSMLHFHQISGGILVTNVQEAYSYWLRTVTNCLLAERAYGPQVVFRLRHSDLVETPEAALRAVFSFVGEPYAPACLTPLAQRINSSHVPSDFEIDLSKTDPNLIEQATQLYQQVEKSSQPLDVSPAAVEEIEAAFNERVQFVATLSSDYRNALEKIAVLKRRNQKISARAERVAVENKKKSAIVRHLRDSWKHSKWLDHLFGTLSKDAAATKEKEEGDSSKANAASRGPLSNSN
jgi:Sulfotransferase family